MKTAILAVIASYIVECAFAEHALLHKRETTPQIPALQQGCCKTVVTVTVYEDSPTPTNGVMFTQNLTTALLSNSQVVQVSQVPQAREAAQAPQPFQAPQPPQASQAPQSSQAPQAPQAPQASRASRASQASQAPQAPQAPQAAQASPALQASQVSTHTNPSSLPKSPSAGIITNGNKWGMTYTPYNQDGSCRDTDSIMKDLQLIKRMGFTTIRTYGTDCNGLASIGGGARASGLKLILGVFIKSSGIDGARGQVADIVNWGNKGNWDLVVMVVTGNEAIHQGFCDGPSLAKFISEVKGVLIGAGQIAIPVTTTDVVSALDANKSYLCPVVDVVAANIHAYFDGKVLASNAGDFVKDQLDQVAGFCPGKPYYNVESGWPSAGPQNGVSVASPDSQKVAMADIVSKVGDKTVVFSFMDDLWKPAGIEQHFGCGQLF